ncbi:MAG: alpha-L-fucosidase, partial [Acidobacteriaceae bacterium]
MPMFGQTEGAAQSAAFHAMNTCTEDYAAYCAKPADQRVFYAYEGGQIIQEKLDEKTWTPTGWGKPP